MRIRLPIILACAFAAAACSAARAQEVVTIPISAVVQQGKKSNFRYDLKLNASANYMGQCIPMKMQFALAQSQKYGWKSKKNGLIPVTTSMSFKPISISIAGKNAIPEFKKAKIPPLPSMTMMFDKQGCVRGFKLSHIPKGAEHLKQILPAINQVASLGTPSWQPVGPMEIGKPIEKSMDMPFQGQRLTYKFVFTPTEVVSAKGEKAVRIMIEGTGQVDMPKLGSASLAASGLPKDMSASIDLVAQGEILIGLNSGEPLSLNIDQSVFWNFIASGMAIDGDIQILANGKKI